MQSHGKHFIAGELSSAGDQTYGSFNPVAGEALPMRFTEATGGEIDRAVVAADQAFGCASPTPQQLATLLEGIAEQVLALGPALLEQAHAETAIPMPRLEAERTRTVNQLRLFASVAREGSWVDARIDTAIPDRKPIPKPDVRRMLIPIGPVIIFGASNLPLAFGVTGGDTASALAAGCPIVVKAHPAHPATSELLGSAIAAAVKDANLPAGWFSMLHGRAPETSIALVKHPLAKAVGFTGSLRAGRAIFDAAAQRPEPIPVYAEMGSVNPVFVLPEAARANAQKIAEALGGSITLSAGQFCTNPGLLIGQDDVIRDVGAKLADLINQSPPASMLNPGIRDHYERGSQRLLDVGNVQTYAQSTATADAKKTQAAARLFSTDARTFLSHHELSEEVFGPSSVLVNCGSKQDLESIAKSLAGQLTATVFATEQDLRDHAKLIAILRSKVGRLICNSPPTGVEVCPSMNHGGPYPATTDVRSTSVGTAAIGRFARPICYQGFPDAALPPELQNANPRNIWRVVNGKVSKDSIA